MTLSFDPDTLWLDARHFSGGAVAGAFGLALHRPSDDVALADAPVAGATSSTKAVETAERALRSFGWGAAPPRDRTCAMHALANPLDAEAPSLAGLEAICSTRPVGQSVPIDIQGKVA